MKNISKKAKNHPNTTSPLHIYPEVTNEYDCKTIISIKNKTYELLFRRRPTYGIEPYLVMEIKTGITFEALEAFNWNYQEDASYMKQLLSHSYLRNCIIYYYNYARDFCDGENRGDLETIRYYNKEKDTFFETYIDTTKVEETIEIDGKQFGYEV